MTTRFIPSADGPIQTVDNDPLVPFAQALQEQRRFRIEQLRELDAASVGESGPLAEVTAALRLAAHTALTEVDAALARLAIGRYGTCLLCEQQIGPERLEIVPMAALCMACQRESETQAGAAHA
jgi:RNA polymerase-binding transcription factor DksA